MKNSINQKSLSMNKAAKRGFGMPQINKNILNSTNDI
jgi:hypothetical protein